MLARFALPLLVCLALVTAGCDGWRQTVLDTQHLDLSGYAYSTDLEHVGDARLQMDLEVVELQRGRNAQPLTHLRGSGTLTVAEKVYTVRFGPETGPFLSTMPWRYPCYEYFSGGTQQSFDSDTRLDLSMRISEDFQHANGILLLPGPGEIPSSGWTEKCFDDEGKRGLEIFKVEFGGIDREGMPVDVAHRALILNLGPEISPLEKLREYRDRIPDGR